MNKVTSPLNPDMRGTDVANLQETLQLLLDRVAILHDDEGTRLKLAQILPGEHERAVYGSVTQKVVAVFQDERQLSVNGAHGAVDDVTAAALNAQLLDWGLLDGESSENGGRQYVVSGQVRREDGLVLAGVRVRAYQQSARPVRLGEDVTDGDGGYTIRYDLLPDLGRGVRLTALGADGVAVASAAIDAPKPVEVMDLTVPVAQEAEPQQRVEGVVLFEDGRPAAQLPLRLYRREFGGGATLIGERATLAGGRYGFEFDATATPGPLDLRAVGPSGEEVALSDPVDRVDGEPVLTLNVVAPTKLAPLVPEYERLTADVAPLVGSLANLAGAKETAEQPDLTLLNRETGWDARLISLAATSQRLAADPDVPLSADVVYGLLRAGLPSDKLLLAQVGVDAAKEALETVHTSGIVAVPDTDRDQFGARFEQFARTVQLGVPAPGSQATYGQLLETSGLDADAKATFASVYLAHRGEAAELWESAAKAGLSATQITQLQTHGKLAYLTGNSSALTDRLRTTVDSGDPVALVDQGLYESEAWITEIDSAAGIPTERRDALSAEDRKALDALIPSRYVGESPEERRALWAQDMARKVRTSYPTHVVAHAIESDASSLSPNLAASPSATAALLKNCAGQGFRLGETPIEPFLVNHTGVRAGMADEEFEAAKSDMKTLQRVYQVTPTNEAMQVAMSLGFKSSYDIAALSQDDFVARYSGKFGSVEITRLVYRKATQVTSLTYNLFAIGKKLDGGTQVQAISGTPEEHAAAKGALKETLKEYPTMESLFGSMDSCECEHCSSVLSPAAYLVDLLQFLDVEPTVWGSFLEGWKDKHGQPYPHPSPYEVLVDRRPDLAHLSLSCDNVETALPYIDIVNEILEFYVANRKLTADAAHDTGDATTAELLAEPQNVLEQAYDDLDAARYPLTLPFDLWLETIRRFCEFFERPLDQVLETFRGGDELFAPARDYDRAAIFAEALGISPAERAIFTDAAPLANDRWHDLYGFWRHRPAISNPTNAGNATLAIADADAEPVRAGDVCTYFDTSAGALAQEARTVADVGAAGSGGAGLTTVTFTGVWTTPPEANDQLVFHGPAALQSAKALARRLGVTYKQLTDIVLTGFANPRLNGLVLLHKLGVAIHSVVLYREPANTALYAQNKDLLDKERGSLSNADKARYDALTQAQWQTLGELQAFEQRLDEFATRYDVPRAQIDAAIAAIPLDEILVLADPDAGCDFDLTTLRYASGRAVDPIALLRINLFVRLWRKLGWSMEEVDCALQTLVPENAPFDTAHLPKKPLETALVSLAHLDALYRRAQGSRLSRMQLLSLWSDLATSGSKPLYASLFLTPSVLRSDDVFDHPLGDYLSQAGLAARAASRTYSVQLRGVAAADKIDPAAFAGEPRIELSYDAGRQIQRLTYRGVLSDADKATLAALSTSPALPKLLDAVQQKAAEFSLIKGHLPALQGPLGLSAEEISLILGAAGQSLDTAALSLPNVSLLYRHRVLASVLKVEVRAIVSLAQLSGLNPFAALHADPLGSLADDHPFTQTLRFVEVADRIAASPLSVEDLDWLIRDRVDAAGKHRPDPAGRLMLLRTLAEGVRAIRAAHAVPTDPGALTDEALRQELGLVLEPDVVERFVAMLNGTVETTVTKTGVAKADALDPRAFTRDPAIREVRYDETRQEQTLTFRGVLLDAQKTALKATLPRPKQGQPHVSSPVFDALLDLVQPRTRAFFETHLRKQPPGKPGGGFLDAADYELLFAPAPDGASEANLQARLRDQRARLAEAFLPFLQQRLVRTFIVQTLVAQTEADPALAESLIVDRALLAHDGAALLDVVTALDRRGVTATLFGTDDLTGAPLKTVTLADVDTALDPAAARSARFEGYLEVPAPGAYRFAVVLGKQGASAKLRFAHLPQPTLQGTASGDNDEVGDGAAEYAELEPGVLYRYTLELENLRGGGARMLVQGETLPRDRASRLALSPEAAIAAADAALTELMKALALLDGLGIGEREARHVLTHPGDFDTVPLNSSDVGKLFAFALRLVAYAGIKRDLGADGADLVEVFEADDVAYERLARITGRDEDTVRATAHVLDPSPSFPSEVPLRRLLDALDVVRQFGVAPESVAGWGRIVSPAATAAERHGVAGDLKEAIKARFEPAAWQRLAQPINDELRSRRRDALVAHVMHQCGFASMEQMYEYFLVDPGMEPVVRTSRLRLAISSVQLFAQRCLLNLERRVPPAAIVNAKQWEWMKRYRVWEANRKIFLFPENWLEPEFRDDKTSLFGELEGALLKDDVSADMVEDAFLAYLRKLEELARLDIVAMHLEAKPDAANNALHVVGRTYSAPHKHFYRRLEHGTWTPWEPITTEIQGDHLAPVVWRDRLCLFWVTFMERGGAPALTDDQSKAPAAGVTLGQVAAINPTTHVDVQLHWCEHLNGEWTAPESSGLPMAIEAAVTAPFDPRSVFVHVSLEPQGDGVFIHLGDPIKTAFFLARRNSAPRLVPATGAPLNVYTANDPRAGHYEGQDALKVTFSPRITSAERKVKPKETPTILGTGESSFALLPCDNDIVLGAPADGTPSEVRTAIQAGLGEIAALMKPVFYQDSANTLYVEPTVSERTIEEWQEWVTTPARQDDGDKKKPDWFDEIVVIPQIPNGTLPKGPGPVEETTINPKARYALTKATDWLVNPGTVLVLDGQLLGAGGRAEAQIVPAGELSKAVVAGGVAVNVHPGSELAVGESLVLTTAGKAGHDLAGGMNVVGAGGLNSGLAQNFKTFQGR